jgi:hypothetical protein
MEYDAKGRQGDEMESVKARFTTVWIDVQLSRRLNASALGIGTELLFLKST